MGNWAVDSVGDMGETKSGKRRGERNKERPERNRKERNPQQEKRRIRQSKETGISIVEAREA